MGDDGPLKNHDLLRDVLICCFNNKYYYCWCCFKNCIKQAPATIYKLYINVLPLILSRDSIIC